MSPTRDFVTKLDLITYFDIITEFRKVSIEHLQRMQLVNRGRVLLQTPGPVKSPMRASFQILNACFTAYFNK